MEVGKASWSILARFSMSLGSEAAAGTISGCFFIIAVGFWTYGAAWAYCNGAV
mgnify:CR=1 FL=1